MSDALLLWPLAYLLHSTLLLGAAWLASRWVRHPVLAETMWRCAFFGAFITATLTLAGPPWPGSSAAPAPAAPARVAAAVGEAARAAPAPVRAQEPAQPAPAAATEAAPTAVATPWARPVWLPPQTRLPLLAASLAWALLAAGGLLATALQWAVLARGCRRLRPNDDADWACSARAIAHRSGLARVPALRVGSPWASPLVGPRGVVCLPDWCLAQLDGAQRDAVLAHEFAHLARRDPAWRLGARVAACLGWMQPLNLIALRRLDALAERACDVRAALAIADRHAVAHALLACASQVASGPRAPRLQPGMAAARSPLVQRVEHLLQADAVQATRRVSRRSWALLGLTLAAGVLLAPAVAVRGRALHAADWRHLLDDAMPGAGSHVAMRSPGDDVDLWIKGAATLRDDRDELGSGQVTLLETTGGVTRRLEVDASSGSAVRRYELDGVPHAPDAAMRRWADRRWELVMSTLLQPGQRVERLLRRGGPELVMASIEHPVDIDTQHRLIEAWAGQRTLDASIVERLIAAIDRAEPAGDDNDRVLSLRDIARRQPLTEPAQRQLLNALSARRGDPDTASALQALLMQFNDRTPESVLVASADLLRALPSDERRRESLEPAVAAGNVAATELALQVAPSFTSDIDRRVLLERVATRLRTAADADDVERYAASARQLRSAGDRGPALLALVEAVPLRATGCLAVLGALDGLDNAAEVTPVLLALARRMPNDAALIKRFRQVARVLPAYERGQVEQALDALPPPA